MFAGTLGISPAIGALTTPLSVTTTSLPGGEVGVVYSTRLVATGGTAPYTWSLSSGVLPTGLSLSSRGLISGTPSVAANQTMTFEVSDAVNSTVTVEFTLGVVVGPTIVTGPLPPAIVGVSYSVQMLVTGGTPPYNWTILSGPLPLGTVLLSSGVLSGIPSELGTTTTTVQVSDAFGLRVSSTVSLQVEAPSVAPASYFTTSNLGGVSVYATPGSAAPQTGDDTLNGVVAIASDEAGDRYWVVTSVGRVVASARTPSYGSVTRRRLSGSIVGMAAEPDGNGYFLVSSTGHVYGFGAAHSFGSVARHDLSGAIVGIALNASATGYWLASSTGRIYAFGTAHRLPETSGGRHHGSVVAITADPKMSGYWTVTRSGRVATYGLATFVGSVPGGDHLNDVDGIAADESGDGYWILTRSGDVLALGGAPTLPGVEVAPDATVTAIAGAA